MAEVKWIKLKVGMFDGESFKKIKRAKIGGESFRDKLTAVWFELMDFAGKCNHSGAFVNSREIPFSSMDDIAIMIDREPDELELCMAFYMNEGMVAIIDDVYMLTNWAEYQNEAGLEKIREQKRLAQARWRAKKALQAQNVDADVDSTQHLPSYSPSSSTSTSKEEIGECEGKEKEMGATERVQYDSIKTLYNEICKSFPRCVAMSEARKKAIKARVNSGYSLDDFKTLFTKAEASSFLKGKNTRNWSATFDWLISDSNMAKVLDGNYDDKGRSHGAGAQDYGSPEDFYK